MNPEKIDRRPIKILCLLLLLGAAFYLAGLDFIQVLEIKNGRIFFSHYHFVEENWEHPRLRLLRKRENLDQVVAPGKTQFEKIVLLRKWTRAQWKESPVFRYPPWDAVEILDLARRHKNYGFCGQYSIVFLQACLSMGLHARYVDLGHFLTEVWSDDYNKWVIMDPTNDLNYERDGVPLKGRELYAASWRNNVTGIAETGSDGARHFVSKDEVLPWRNYSIILRNNHLSAPILMDINGKRSPLTIQTDYLKYPLVGAQDSIGYGAEFLDWHMPELASATFHHGLDSVDADDFRDAFNQTIIMVASVKEKKGWVKLKLLAENAPGFQTFLVRDPVDASKYSETGEQIMMTLSPGVNVLYARIRTKSGWLGPESRIKIFYKPNFLRKMFGKTEGSDF